MTLGRAIAKYISLRAPLFSLGPRGLGGSRRSKMGMGLQPGVFASGTHIPLMGSYFVDFQGTGESASAWR